MFGLKIRCGIETIDFAMLMELTEMVFVRFEIELIFGVLWWCNESNCGFQGTDMADLIFAFVDTFA